MKRIILLLAFVVISVGAFGQGVLFDSNPKDNFVPVKKYFRSVTNSGDTAIIFVLADGTEVSTDSLYFTGTSQEAIEDYIGAMLSGNTETGISVTYQDGDGTIDFVISDLSGTYQTVLTNEAGLYDALTDVNQFLEAGDNAALLDGTAYRIFATNGSGDVTEIALGTSGQVLMSNGASSLPSFQDEAGGEGGGWAVNDSSEVLQDLIGAMVSGNTETNITVTYQDADGTLDFEASGSGLPASVQIDSFLYRSADSTVLAIHNGDTLGWYWPIEIRSSLPVFDGTQAGIVAVDDNPSDTGQYMDPQGDWRQIPVGEVTQQEFEDSISTLRVRIAALEVAISNMGDYLPPSLTSMEIFGDSVVGIFNENLHAGNVPPTSAFNLTEDGTTMGIASLRLSYDSIIYSLDSAGAYGYTYLIDYTKDNPVLQDSSENQIPSWTDYAVANNLPNPSALSDDMQAIMTAFTDAPTGDTLLWYTEFEDTLKYYGIWDTIDVLHMTAAKNTASANVNWINPGTHDLTDPGSTAPSFTAWEGYAYDGSSDYHCLNYNIAEDSINTGLSNLSYGIYNRVTVETNSVPIGARYTSNTFIQLSGVGFNQFKGFINASTSTGTDEFVGGTNTTDIGLMGVDRNSTGMMALYEHGSLINSTDTLELGDVNAYDWFLGARNTGAYPPPTGTAGQFGAYELSFDFIAGALTSEQWLKLAQAVERFLDHFGTGQVD